MTSPIIAVRTSYAATQIGDRTLHIVRNRHVNAYRANENHGAALHGQTRTIVASKTQL
ncbi:hypothetical protein HOLleu_38367 [Holothuria leucospilota]|uniref:Uncharacterized protein n=1 Tax=Holothuria leucospilota TaxID=206669 RepID=A0A9Q1BDI3_HOLLE|nr:hypothetical protein HOLleu_38367 [Holothuria leucospilota]